MFILAPLETPKARAIPRLEVTVPLLLALYCCYCDSMRLRRHISIIGIGVNVDEKAYAEKIQSRKEEVCRYSMQNV